MDLDAMHTFLEVVEQGAFGRAAEELHVAQSTVSARVRALEAWLGQRLFDRGRAGARLTPEGERFFDYARTFVRLARQARHEVALPRGTERVLAGALQVSLWSWLGPPWVAWMRRALPRVGLDVAIEYSDTQMRLLRAGLLSFGVMYGPEPASAFLVEELLVEELVLVSTRRPRSAALPSGYLRVDWGRDFHDWQARVHPEAPPAALAFGLGALALEVMLARGGAAYLPRWTVAPLLREGRLHEVPDAPVFRRPSYLVVLRERAEDPVVLRALEGLREVAGRAPRRRARAR